MRLCTSHLLLLVFSIGLAGCGEGGAELPPPGKTTLPAPSELPGFKERGEVFKKNPGAKTLPRPAPPPKAK
jgi:hypothetical protein